MGVRVNIGAAIPQRAGKVDGWRTVPLSEKDEPLVAIGHGTDYDDILTSAVYAGEHLHSPYRGDNVIDNADPMLYVRESVARRLLQAQSMLPSGFTLIVFDGYRSAAVQKALFDQFMNELRTLKPTWTEAQLLEETERYVSQPSMNPHNPSPHSTGGAVDVAIVKDNRMIEFGTPFDHGSARSALRYYEDPVHVVDDVDREARDNRRMLYNVMHEAGFEGFEHEWWHYNAIETQMGASCSGRIEATYGVADSLILQARTRGRNHARTTSTEPSAPIDRIVPMS